MLEINLGLAQRTVFSIARKQVDGLGDSAAPRDGNELARVEAEKFARVEVLLRPLGAAVRPLDIGTRVVVANTERVDLERGPDVVRVVRAVVSCA